MRELDRYRVVAFTHKCIPLSKIGHLVFGEDALSTIIPAVKAKFGLDEIAYLETCNRIEFIMVSNSSWSPAFLQDFLRELYPKEDQLISQCIDLQGEAAVVHLFSVMSSLDSMVVGEREIITQTRLAFEKAHKQSLSGPYLRALQQKATEVSKYVHQSTSIGEGKISVASIACDLLRQKINLSNPRILLIGAGQIIEWVSKYLCHHHFDKIYLYNRTPKKAEAIAKALNADNRSLRNIDQHKEGFDVIITCTGAKDPIITPSIFKQLLNGESAAQKLILDLALPSDTSPEVLREYPVSFIGMNEINEQVKNSFTARRIEASKAKQFIIDAVDEFIRDIKNREIELTMSPFPDQVKAISHQAVFELFEDDLANLPEESRQKIQEVIQYMEKKYIKYPMMNAKEIFSG